MNITAFLKPQWLLLALFITIQLGLVSVYAETTEAHSDTPITTPQDLNKESLQAKIDALSERKGLDDSLKSKLLASYQSALDNLASIATFNEQTATFKNAIQQAPELTRKLQKDIDHASEKQTKPDPDDFIKIPIEELTQRLVIEQDKVNNLDEQIRKLDNQLAEQNTRPNFIRQELLFAKQQLDEALKKLKESSSDTHHSKLEIDAMQLYLKTQVDVKSAELNSLDAETSSYAVRLGLLKDQLQLLRLQRNTNAPLIDTIENVLAELRDQEEKDRQDALIQAEKELVGKPIVIQDVTRENIQYSLQLQAINEKIAFYRDEKAKTTKQISDIDADFSSAAKKIDLASLSPPLGKLLHEQRRNLVNQEQFGEQSSSIKIESASTNLDQLAAEDKLKHLADTAKKIDLASLSPPLTKLLNEKRRNQVNKEQFADQSDFIGAETANTNLEQLTIEEKLKQLADINAYLKQKMDTSVSTKIPSQQRMMTQAELRVLVNYQAELLAKLSLAYNTYLRTLGDFDFARQEKHNKIEKFALYLDEHLLWVRSSESGSMEGLYKSIRWLLSPTNWLVVVENIPNLPSKKPFLVTLALLNIGILLLIEKWIKQRLIIISDKVGRLYADHFYYTLEILFYTILLNLPVPLIFFYLGELLSSNAVNDHFTQSIGMGIKHVSVVLFSLQLLYRLCDPTGILRKHFEWQEGVIQLLHKHLAWLRFVLVMGAFIVKTTQISNIPVYSDNLGRLAININVLALTFFLTRILHPQHGLIQYARHSQPTTWLVKLRYVYYALAFSPLIILGFSIAGYYLSAIELQQKLSVSLWLIAILIIAYEIGLRALMLLNRHLAVRNLQQKRHLTTDPDHPPTQGEEEQIIDISSVNTQTVTILNIVFLFSLVAGGWLIWHNIFSAFSFLERIELWRNRVTINNQEIEQAITLVNLFWAGVYGFTVLVLVRNLAGITEILLFSRVTIVSGSRYAIHQLSKYLLITVGFFAITNELGFSWSQVQWLVAALSVGLGFGLQEIFANFVSGIILLFERPIRVGDTVTIGDVSGKVSRIHMRATTLIDFDQKELIVPNKTFITTQLVNWSLSDAITRLVIHVDIAYDSDIELAHEVMMNTVIETPFVLTTPAPSVLLLAFGDSALRFSVYVYVSETAHRLPVTHDLHLRIAKALKAHHIEIPFPQRDIHIRSVVTEQQHPNVA